MFLQFGMSDFLDFMGNVILLRESFLWFTGVFLFWFHIRTVWHRMTVSLILHSSHSDCSWFKNLIYYPWTIIAFMSLLCIDLILHLIQLHLFRFHLLGGWFYFLFDQLIYIFSSITSSAFLRSSSVWEWVSYNN